MSFRTWTSDDWIRHYAGPRWSGRADPGSAWDTEGRRVPGELIKVDGGESFIMTTDEVREAKAALQERYEGLLAQVNACKLLDPDEYEEFHGLLMEWRAFYCGGVDDGRPEPHVEAVGLATQMNDNERFVQRLRGWQTRLAERQTAGETAEDREDKRNRPFVILSLLAGAAYFFGTSERPEFFKGGLDIVERRRRQARVFGGDEVEIKTTAIGADLGEKVGEVLRARSPELGSDAITTPLLLPSHRPQNILPESSEPNENRDEDDEE